MGKDGGLKNYRLIAEELAQIRLSGGRDVHPMRAVILYQRTYKTTLTPKNRRMFMKGWRRGKMIYWLKRMFYRSRQMTAEEIEKATETLKQLVNEPIEADEENDE